MQAQFLLEEQPRSATCRAQGQVSLYRISKVDFDGVCGRFPAERRRMEEIAAKHGLACLLHEKPFQEAPCRN